MCRDGGLSGRRRGGQRRDAASRPGVARDNPGRAGGGHDTASDAAITLRRDWGLAPGAVPQLIRLIEDAGGLVLVRDLGSRELDAVTQWIDGEPPLFLINAHAPADRFRFSLAHELGHVIM